MNIKAPTPCTLRRYRLEMEKMKFFRDIRQCNIDIDNIRSATLRYICELIKI